MFTVYMDLRAGLFMLGVTIYREEGSYIYRYVDLKIGGWPVLCTAESCNSCP